MNINEDFLHYVWKNRLFNLPLYLLTGEEIEVIDPGQHNQDSGPDFFNAKIRIKGTVWAGNVEIHQNASDWNKHGHQNDDSYQNIILHVVQNNDCEITSSDGQLIPTVEITFNERLFTDYNSMLQNIGWIPCGSAIQNIDPLILNFWLSRLMVERLELKSESVKKNFKESKGDWRETIFRQLAKNFGFKINSLPFELMAKSLNYKHLMNHNDSIFQIEALLFGQGGFLGELKGDEYYLQLRGEYEFLRTKYNLKPINYNLWKFLRLRPANFPTIRIAQFAGLIAHNPGFIPGFFEYKVNQIENILSSIYLSEYWKNHYVFNKISTSRLKSPGQSSIQNIIINTMVPVLFEYGCQTGNQEYRTKAFTLMENLAPESNAVIRGWKNLKICVPNAFYSQALIHLKNNYCNFKKCLYCQVGNQILR